MQTATTLAPADQKQARELRGEIKRISQEISDLEERRRDKARQLDDAERKLREVGVDPNVNGQLRKIVRAAIEDKHVFTAEISGLDSLLGEARAELKELMASLAPLETRERDAAVLRDLEKKDAEFGELKLEHQQRSQIATYATQRMGEIISRFRMQQKDLLRLTEHENVIIKQAAINLRNRVTQAVEQSQWDNEKFVAAIQKHLADGWR